MSEKENKELEKEIKTKKKFMFEMQIILELMHKIVFYCLS